MNAYIKELKEFFNFVIAIRVGQILKWSGVALIAPAALLVWLFYELAKNAKETASEVVSGATVLGRIKSVAFFMVWLFIAMGILVAACRIAFYIYAWVIAKLL